MNIPNINPNSGLYFIMFLILMRSYSIHSTGTFTFWLVIMLVLYSSLAGRHFNLAVVLGSVCMFTTAIPSLQVMLSQCLIKLIIL